MQIWMWAAKMPRTAEDEVQQRKWTSSWMNACHRQIGKRSRILMRQQPLLHESASGEVRHVRMRNRARTWLMIRRWKEAFGTPAYGDENMEMHGYDGCPENNMEHNRHRYGSLETEPAHSGRASFRVRIELLTALAASSITYISSGLQSAKTASMSPIKCGQESCTLSERSLSTLVCRALATFTSEGKLIFVAALSVWDMCWLVTPTISASCSCVSPADRRALRILCPNST